MMNNNLWQDYQDDVLKIFKLHYKKLSAKDLNLQFNQVLYSTFEELGIKDFAEKDIHFLEDWYRLVHEQSFMHKFLQINELNEIIFHSNESIQILSAQTKDIFSLLHLSIEDYQLSIDMFALKHNVSWNFSHPFVSFFALIHGHPFRVSLIHYSTSANSKSKVFLRSLQSLNPTLNLFNEHLDQITFLKDQIHLKKNILISGCTGSGKTTFLRALINEISPNEHLIVLEDTHEIICNSPQHTSLLAQNDLAKKTLKDYCAYALRMSPDRLIIGEMRSTEVVPFLLAMNTGHKGLMSTVHANSSSDALTRIALLFSLYAENKELDFKLVLKLVCKNIDFVVHVEDKKIKEIARVLGSEGETPYVELIS